MYRIESSRSSVDDEQTFRRQKYKAYFFFIVDLVVLVTCLISLIIMFGEWKECYFNFNSWAFIIVVFSLLSLLLNFATVYYLFKGNKHQKESDRETLVRIARASSEVD